MKINTSKLDMLTLNILIITFLLIGLISIIGNEFAFSLGCSSMVLNLNIIKLLIIKGVI